MQSLDLLQRKLLAFVDLSIEPAQVFLILGIVLARQVFQQGSKQ